MFSKFYPLALAAMLGIGAWAAPGSSASAAIVFMPNQLGAVEAAEGDNGLLQQVNHRVNRRWDRALHGDRYRYRRDRHRHYYNGYYYATPWWLFTAPLVIGGTYATRRNWGDRHIQWCLDRYRSYNPRYNTWVSRSGEVRQCYSPYY